MDSIFLFKLFTSPLEFFTILIVVSFSVCLHEYFHARAALRFGDTTAADSGHLTLNPLVQMGPYSIIMLLLLGICWGAVPVNKSVLRARSKWAPPLVDFAGPCANLLLFIVAFLLFGFLTPRMYLLIQSETVGSTILLIILLLGVYNLTLFLFNLLPIPGLDGWNIVSYFFPKMNYVSSEFVKGAMLLLFFAAFFLIQYVFVFAQIIMLMGPNWLS